jgi:Ca-activated chloride channel family protein
VLAPAPLQITVNVDLVTLDFYVEDATGKPITSLRREDFTVLEDGQERPVQYFESAETPYNILLLFDRSASTEDQWLFLAKATSAFVGMLPDRHQVALAAFDDAPEMLLTWRGAREFGRRANPIETRNGGSGVYRALEWTVQESKGVKGRKGVLVFTDGIDNRLSKEVVSFDREGNPRIASVASDNDFQKMLKVVTEARMPFYFVAVNTDKNPDQREAFNSFRQQQRIAARERMEVVANRSNGAIHYPQKVEEISSLYEIIGKTLGYGYTLGFEPAHKARDGSFHRIEIRLKDKAMRVHPSRDGYYAP